MTAKSLLGVLALTALALSGCAQAQPAAFDDASTYKCLDHTIDGEALAAATPIGELTGVAATAVAEATWDDGSDLVLDDDAAWYFAGMNEGDILIMRELPADDVGDYGLPNSDHELMMLHWVEGSPNLADGWFVWANSVCPLTIDLGSLNIPTAQLDPKNPPDPEAAAVQLLVTETECNSGQSAEGRVKLVSLVETEESVIVTIGVSPNSGDHTCPSNPATPFVVQLESPIGDRSLVDGTRGLPITEP